MTWLLTVAIMSYVGICVLLFVMQKRMVYCPTREIEMTPEKMLLEYEEVSIASGRETLNCWYVPAQDARGTLLFCHGNAGNLGDRVESIDVFNRLGLNVFIFDYRGYGKSTGSPSERGTYEDAAAAWEYLTRQRGEKPERIVVFGRSLGGAVAANLATRVEARALVLESAFTSAPDMAWSMFAWLPTGLIVRFKYRTIDCVRQVSCPLLIAHSPGDEIVSYAHGRALYDAAREPKGFLQMTGGHNDGYVVTGDRYVEGLDAFLTPILGPNAGAHTLRGRGSM